MEGDRKREIWPCLYDMGQNFLFLEQIVSSREARARTASRISRGRRAEKY